MRLSLVAFAVLVTVISKAEPAQSYQHFVSLTLAKNYETNKEISQYWASKKLDGIRVVWNGQFLHTRVERKYMLLYGSQPHYLIKPLMVSFGQDEEIFILFRGRYSIDSPPTVLGVIYRLLCSTCRINQAITDFDMSSSLTY